MFAGMPVLLRRLGGSAHVVDAISSPSSRSHQSTLCALDQGFIYLLAVGSLSPFALTFLRTPGWMAFYALSALLATAGFVSKVLFTHRVDKISLWFYLVLGWGQAIAMIPLLEILPREALIWLLAGAGFYTVGVVFLVLDIRHLRFHAIWHLFVLAACACHYFAILRYVVQGG